MSMKESFKKIERATGRYALILTRGLLKRLPYGVYRVFVKVLILISRPILVKKRRLAIENLKTALGDEKTEAERKQIADACFENFGRGMIDLLYFIDRPDMIKRNVVFEGKEHLDKALAAGKGVVLVSAHFGNFIMMYYRLVLEGYPTNVIMRRVRDQEFEKYISEFRQERGIKTIYDLPPRKCVTDSLKALRNNEILIILLDQNYGTDGRVFVDFFGHPAATAAGPVVFGGRTGAPILPTFILLDEKTGSLDRHKIIIDPPVTLENVGDDQANVVHNVSRLTKIIEKYIRLYPYEWGGWMHKRWKSKTLEEQAIIDRLRKEEQASKY